MLSHVPLNRGAFSRSPELRESGFCNAQAGPARQVLTTKGWFNRGHQVGKCVRVWVPPPAAVDAAFEQLCKARPDKPETHTS
jgi:hypothetical protein